MGEIRCYTTGRGKFKAFTQYRDFDGTTRQVSRTGRSEADAKARLKEACRDRGRTDTEAEINRDTTVTALAEYWFSEIAVAVAMGDKSPGTGRLYRDRLDRQVLPTIGGLRLREVTVSRVDLVLKRIRENHGVAVAKVTRTVLSGMFGLAARHDAIPSNPVRDASTLPNRSKPRYALTLEQVWDLRAKVAADQKAIDWDLVDLIDMMLASGLRIGETAAITWPALDLDAGTLEVRGTVIWVKGQGDMIKFKPKSEAGWRVIELPSWAVAMLRRRHEEQDGPNSWLAVFTSPLGRLRDPSNTQADLKDVFGRVGYPQITSHTFRRTVATLMDGAGLSARAAADQLGHAKVSMTQDKYYGRGVAKTGAARVLEDISKGPSETEDSPDKHD